jgi:pyruvate-formate lyase
MILEKTKRSAFLSHYCNKQGEFLTDKLIHCEPNPNEMVDILYEFTKTYMAFNPNDIEKREAACLNVQLKGRVRPIAKGDLFAGRMEQMPISFTPQSKGTGMGYCMHPDIDKILLSREELTEVNKEILEEMMRFWQEEGTVAKSRKKMPESIQKILPSELYYLESGIAFSLYRMAGIQMDYHKLVKLGIPGLKREISQQKIEKASDKKAILLYDAMESALDSFSDLCIFYAEQALALATNSKDQNEVNELKEMAQVLQNISTKKPETFREGLQLVYLYNKFDGAKNYGRMDDYLADLYDNDIKSGRIDEEEAIRLISGIWQLMISRDNRYDTRVVIGGLGRHHEKKADAVAMIIMETTKRVADIVPQLALRFHKKQDSKLYQKALDVLASGNTYPMLYNDEVNIPSAQKAFDIPYKEAVHVIQYGCGEYVLNHRSVGTPSGVINLLQALLVTMNRGIDPTTGKTMGMPLESYLKYHNFKTFEDLLHAYKEQVAYHVEPLALQEYLEYKHAAEDNAYLTSSILMNDCIEKGKAIFDGGIRHLGGTLETYGNTNTADSLLAIKKLVYEEKKFTLHELTELLKANFKGFDLERKMLLDYPKYGNDDDQADNMLQEIHEHICTLTREQAQKVGLDSYLVVVINNDANTVMGGFTSASPDGRKAFTYLNPGNNPSGGADKSGVTAFLNSLAKPRTDLHAGAVQNMKFSKEVLTKHKDMFEVLMDTYFEKGGAQAMLTVTSKGELEEAMKHPEKYQNLIVRVGGFSERFVNLPPETQREVLSRTLN